MNSEVIDILETEYSSLVGDLDDDLTEAIENVRIRFREFYQSLEVDKVITVDVNTQPATQLAFNYYGDLSKYDELVDLNSSINPVELEGSIKVVESA